MCRRSEAAVPTPTRWATWSTGRSVVSSSRRASDTRCWVSQRLGLTPTSARKPASECPHAHGGVGGQVSERQRGVELIERPRPGVGGRRLRRARHRVVDVLSLAAVTMWRHDARPRHPVGHVHAVVAADDVEAQVDPGCRPGGREHVAVVDVEHVRVEADARVAGTERRGVAPVRRRRPPVEQPGVGEDVDRRADRGEAHARPQTPQRRPDGVERAVRRRPRRRPRRSRCR